MAGWRTHKRGTHTPLHHSLGNNDLFVTLGGYDEDRKRKQQRQEDTLFRNKERANVETAADFGGQDVADSHEPVGYQPSSIAAVSGEGFYQEEEDGGK